MSTEPSQGVIVDEPHCPTCGHAESRHADTSEHYRRIGGAERVCFVGTLYGQHKPTGNPIGCPCPAVPASIRPKVPR